MQSAFITGYHSKFADIKQKPSENDTILLKLQNALLRNGLNFELYRSQIETSLLFPQGAFPGNHIRTARGWRGADWISVSQGRDPLARVLGHHCDGKLLLRPRHWSRHYLQQRSFSIVQLSCIQDSYRKLGRLWLPSLATDTNTRAAQCLLFGIQEVCQGVLRVSRMNRGCGGLESPMVWRRQVGWYRKVSTRRGSSPNLVRNGYVAKISRDRFWPPGQLQHPSQAATSPGRYNPSLKPPVKFTMLPPISEGINGNLEGSDASICCSVNIAASFKQQLHHLSIIL